MKKFVFTIDGVEYRNIHVVSVKRSFSVLDGENAGRTMDGAMQRDIIGTYYNYSLEIDPMDSKPDEYDALYEAVRSDIRAGQQPYCVLPLWAGRAVVLGVCFQQGG